MYSNLLCSTTGSIATIVINRPAVRNALNAATIEELRAAFEALREDSGVRVVIVTGSGEKAFVAGADIAEIAGLNPKEGEAFARRGQSMFDAIEHLDKPVIAAVNGYALGGGCELALACTIRVASENAMFGQPEVKLGIIPGYGGTQRLPRLVGKGRALELLLTGAMVSASEALRIGLVNHVVPQSELQSATETLAKKIMGNAPQAVRFCLQAVHRGLDTTQGDGQSLEASLFGLCCATEDMLEGTKSFLEKRAPNFKGK
jgi:enoyl-CoA hydratase/carnithine racemase